MSLPNDRFHRAVTEWDPFARDLRLTEEEILGRLGPTCTCPDWWFPQDIREVARRLPHNYGGLTHYKDCAKTLDKRSWWKRPTDFED